MAKRTDRIRLPRQIGLDPEMGLVIRGRAEAKGRSIEMQIVYLLIEGIKADPEAFANEDRRGWLQVAAHEGTTPHMGAQPRSARHATAQKQELA